MRDAPAPRLHLLVCANRREGSPLGPGCGDRGDAVYDALKREVAVRGRIATTWITKTACLGICPERGATVARWPANAGLPSSPIVTEVVPADIAQLLAEAGGLRDPRRRDPAAHGDLALERVVDRVPAVAASRAERRSLTTVGTDEEVKSRGRGVPHGASMSSTVSTSTSRHLHGRT